MHQAIVSYSTKFYFLTNIDYLTDKCRKMKEGEKNLKKDPEDSRVEEVFVPYSSRPLIYTPEENVKNPPKFTYNIFKSIADQSPFTLNEWAQLLFISERTLHRYANDEAPFNGLQIDRILLLEELIETGNDFLGEKKFKRWVFSNPYAMGGQRVFDTLFSAQGIRYAIDVLHRVQHGIPL